MMLKAIVFATLAVAVFAEYPLTEDKRAELRGMITKQCQKYNATDKVDELEKVVMTYAECIFGVIDMKTLKRNIENGALNEEVQKYCTKSPQLKTCFYNLLDGVSPCIDSSAREDISFVKSGTNQLIDFVCYKNGDRVAQFIADGGLFCLYSKADDLSKCSSEFQDSFSSDEAAKALTLTEKCTKFEELAACVVAKLETCGTSTPGNMAESLFRFIREGLPCKAQA